MAALSACFLTIQPEEVLGGRDLKLVTIGRAAVFVSASARFAARGASQPL